MAIKSLARSTIRQSQRNNSALAGYESNYFHHLETVRLGGATTDIVFTNLSRYSDFQHFQIRFVARTNRASSLDSVQLQFNSDTNGNYSWHNLQGSSSSVTSQAGANAVRIPLAYAPGSTNTANSFAGGVTEILDVFDTTKHKTVRSFAGQVDGNWTLTNIWSGSWRSTDAVTSIRLHSDNATGYIAGSRFSLYGLKAKA
jgi:hypothetical protein